MINKNWVSWCWQLGVLGAVVAGAIASGFECAQAQSKIVPDSTLGAESSVVQTSSNGSPIEIISGGAIRGINLFHSFLEFNVSSGRGAYFLSPNVDIQNILARVTGSNRSEILGTIGTFGASNPNLFLINPNGIIFGQNASLDMGNAGPNVGGTGGSFVATTANAVLLGNNGIFSASEPAKSNLLSVNPSALLFNAISGQGIINKSTATQSVLGYEANGLQVPNGRSLLLVGGDVQLVGGNLFVQDGRVELGGLAGAGTVGLNIDGNHLSLSFPQQVQLADVSLTNGSIISVPASDSGSTAINADNQNILGGINITARSLALTNDAALVTATFGKGNAGSIAINARDTVTMDYSSVFSSVEQGSVGTGGDINITAGSVALTNGTQLNTTTSGQAKAGNVTINARDTVTFDGTADSIYHSGVSSKVEEGAVGTGGDINITTGSLTVRNGAELGTSTFGQGNAGSITINARDAVSLDGRSSVSSAVSTDMSPNVIGNGGNINITTGSLALTNDAQLATATYAKGNAGSITINARDTVTMDYSSVFSTVLEGAVGSGGDINITTGSLALTNGTQLNTTTYGRAKAGNVTINARDTVTFDGTAADSTDGYRDPSGVFSNVQEGAVGTAGDINITTGSLALTNGAQLTASTSGQGNAGNVTVNARDTVTFDGTDGNVGNVGSSGAFSQVELTGVGKGGIIDITSGSFALTNGAQLSARTRGQGNGGNVTINARNGSFTLTNGALLTSFTTGQGNAGSVTVDTRDTLQLNNSQITTNSTSSNGGDITLSAKDIRLRNNSLIRTDLSSGQGSGGNITLTANTILALEDSDILAFASQGRGGNITFNTRAFLSDPLYRPTPPTTEEATFASFNNNGRVDLNASGAVSGAITGVPDISFIQNSLTELPQNLINANVLIANSCIAHSSKQQGTFTITGAGGLPNRPGDAVLSSYPTGDVRSVPSGGASRPWHKGDPIVEPQGLYHLPDGHLVLSRECSE